MEKLFDIADLELFRKAISLILQDLYFDEENVIKNIPLPTPDWNQAKTELQQLFTYTKFDTDKIKDSLLSNTWADQSKVEACIQAINCNINKLILQSVQKHNTESGKTLLDFDWVIKLILGTSTLKSLNYDVIQLILTTADSKSISKNTPYELNKDVLLKLITLLENFCFS